MNTKFDIKRSIPAYPANVPVFQSVMARAKVLFPKMQGMTRVGPNYVIVQEFGNRAPLVMEVSSSEAAACGFAKF